MATKQVTPKEKAAAPPSVVNKAQPPAVVQGPGAEVLRSDILVPYIIMGQGLSDAVVERKVNLGDIYRSTSLEVLGGPDAPVDAIFLHYPKSNWILEQKTGSRFQYRKTLPRTAANETLEWTFWGDNDGNEVQEGSKGATEWRRVKQLMVFAILPKDIEAAKVEMAKAEAGELPDPSKALTPVIFSFRSFGFKAGKEVCTFFTQAQSMNVPIWKYSLSVGNYLDKNDEGTFYVWKVDRTKAKAVHKDYLPLVENWVKLMNSGLELKTDEGAENSNVSRAADTREVC